MLMPRFSLRTILIAITVFAVLSYVAAKGFQGNVTAAVTVIFLSVAAFLILFQAVTFFLVWAVQQLWSARRRRHPKNLGASPFRTAPESPTV
jgi:hypothetical protein